MRLGRDRLVGFFQGLAAGARLLGRLLELLHLLMRLGRFNDLAGSTLLGELAGAIFGPLTTWHVYYAWSYKERRFTVSSTERLSLVASPAYPPMITLPHAERKKRLRRARHTIARAGADGEGALFAFDVKREPESIDVLILTNKTRNQVCAIDPDGTLHTQVWLRQPPANMFVWHASSNYALTAEERDDWASLLVSFLYVPGILCVDRQTRHWAAHLHRLDYPINALPPARRVTQRELEARVAILERRYAPAAPICMQASARHPLVWLRITRYAPIARYDVPQCRAPYTPCIQPTQCTESTPS